jgi:transcriptional regulator
MYLPAHFAETRMPVLHALMHDHPLATLVTFGPGGMTANHIPLEVRPGANPDEPGVLLGHVARANALWKEHDTKVEVLAIFQGPGHYMSPGWYPTKKETGKVVPTWNYCTVHVHGPLVVHDDVAWLRDFVGHLTRRHEAGMAAPWKVEDAPEDYLKTMLGAIVGIEIPITRIVGKWKVSQNQPEQNRQGVMAGLAALGDETSLAMAELVRANPPKHKPA